MSSDSPAIEPLLWQEAVVKSVEIQSPRVKSFMLAPMSPLHFLAGQHVDLRLTAPDGYQAQRSYSIASAPEVSDAFELGIELMPDGEVSPFFHDVVAPGDTIEFRGPIGGHFNWEAGDGGPILLVGGGSGIVPLLSILRHRANVAPSVKMALVYSSRTVGDVIFREELLRRADTEPNFQLFVAVTREESGDSRFHSGRIDETLVRQALSSFGTEAPKRTYVCGANRFVETATRLVISAGIPAGAIRTERYGGAD